VANKVTVTRTEIQQIVDELIIIIEKLKGIIERQDTRPVETDEKGWPKLGWEAHDDPEQS
jgi:hypothetical protein